MQDALAHIDAIRARIRADGCMLLLDFDGTLAPLVDSPLEAEMSHTTLTALRACAARFPSAIITGRTLVDVEVRVGIAELWYAGSHGLEWKRGGKVERHPTPMSAVEALAAAKIALRPVVARYPKTISEDKGHCFAINYRALDMDDAKRFQKEAFAAAHPYLGHAKLRLMDGLRTFDIAPAVDWTKGECAQLLLRKARELTNEKLVPLAIGDSITDEDMFRAMRDGITVRVGEDHGSAAQYFCETRDDVDTLLQMVAAS